jgi:hypothetical protein
MTNLVSSPARLAESSRIDLFVELFASHGALGAAVDAREFSEEERMRVVPLVFGLMPRQALYRQTRDRLMKPLIREHLDAIGAPSDHETLVSLIKEVADQFVLTACPNAVRRKMTVADLRTRYGREYRRLRDRQQVRCGICGASLTDHEEHLDHRIPFRLVGDVSDGANWQLLCGPCNVGKWSWFSALQPPASQNWLYGDVDLEGRGEPTAQRMPLGLTLRYSVLAQRRQCEVAGCNRTPRESRLQIAVRHASGLSVIDNLKVLCEQHAALDSSGVLGGGESA